MYIAVVYILLKVLCHGVRSIYVRRNFLIANMLCSLISDVWTTPPIKTRSNLSQTCCFRTDFECRRGLKYPQLRLQRPSKRVETHDERVFCLKRDKSLLNWPSSRMPLNQDCPTEIGTVGNYDMYIYIHPVFITGYGSTLYMGIAIVFVFSPYILKISSFQVIHNFTVQHMLKLSCMPNIFLPLFLLVELTYLNNHSTNRYETWYLNMFWWLLYIISHDSHVIKWQ